MMFNASALAKAAWLHGFNQTSWNSHEHSLKLKMLLAPWDMTQILLLA
jgi:hypothetical protein